MLISKLIFPRRKKKASRKPQGWRIRPEHVFHGERPPEGSQGHLPLLGWGLTLGSQVGAGWVSGKHHCMFSIPEDACVPI